MYWYNQVTSWRNNESKIYSKAYNINESENYSKSFNSIIVYLENGVTQT